MASGLDWDRPLESRVSIALMPKAVIANSKTRRRNRRAGRGREVMALQNNSVALKNDHGVANNGAAG